MPIEGNAAANTRDFLDLTGANVSPARLPDGFTARGIVALVFSVIAGLVGVGVVAWYGLGELGAAQQAKTAAEFGATGAVARTASGAKSATEGSSLGGSSSTSGTGGAQGRPTTVHGITTVAK